ncbi:hypothetical protein [Gimesia algae]|uniref:Uncharacterized protein n=1 Tax=Gimesia algae TaxID=2527971 RepID=A0A517VNA6_9PLAN|nr:hypothetical protein [Gimesia algae]QDT94479.1 hypothetical protein Pan161_61750 [Gimesia algae]
MTDSPPGPRVRTSRQRSEQIVRLIKKMIGRGSYLSEIKTAIAEEFNLSRRSVERYITRARREMLKEVEQGLEQHRADSLYFYRSVIDSPKSTERDRLRARERIDRLLGLDTKATPRKKAWLRKLTPEALRKMSNAELEATRQRVIREREQSPDEYY